jgi:hypothetical protein
MKIKSKSWTNYSKEMAATIIQTRWRKYCKKKNGLDESMYSVSVVSKYSKSNTRAHETGVEKVKKKSGAIKKSAFYQPPDTARTDQVLIDI